MQEATSPPVDLRYLCKPRVTERSHEVRADVVSFLSNVYTSCAETLPDVRDDPLSAEEELVLQRPGDSETQDPYAEKLANMASEKKELPSVQSCRKRKKGVEINQLRTLEKRFLPPGCMKDYWEQYVLMSPLAKPASFPTFWRVLGLA